MIAAPNADAFVLQAALILIKQTIARRQLDHTVPNHLVDVLPDAAKVQRQLHAADQYRRVRLVACCTPRPAVAVLRVDPP